MVCRGMAHGKGPPYMWYNIYLFAWKQLYQRGLSGVTNQAKTCSFSPLELRITRWGQTYQCHSLIAILNIPYNLIFFRLYTACQVYSSSTTYNNVCLFASDQHLIGQGTEIKYFHWLKCYAWNLNFKIYRLTPFQFVKTFLCVSLLPPPLSVSQCPHYNPAIIEPAVRLGWHEIMCMYYIQVLKGMMCEQGLPNGAVFPLSLLHNVLDPTVLRAKRPLLKMCTPTAEAG